MSITYTVEKKENALIIHSGLEIYFYEKFQYFISMLFFEIFATPPSFLDSEPGTPLVILFVCSSFYKILPESFFISNLFMIQVILIYLLLIYY